MVQDEKQWNLGLAKLNAFMQSIRGPYDEDDVAHFHEIITILEHACGENLSTFKIPADKLKPRVVSVQRASYSGRPGHTRYADKKVCDPSYFLAQVQGIANYLPSLRSGQHAGDASPYESLPDRRLQELLIDRRIKPKRVIDDRGERFIYDRAHAIAELLKKDRGPAAATVSNVFNIHDSNFVNSSPGASITQNIGLKGSEFRSLLAELTQSSKSGGLSEENQAQIKVDIGTIELQITSPRPNHSVIKASLESIMRILEHAAGIVVGEAALFKIKSYLHTL
jgi:hypothetical protein